MDAKWGFIDTRDRSRSNRENWDAYKAREENARLWRQSNVGQTVTKSRTRAWDKNDWFNNMYSHNPDLLNRNVLEDEFPATFRVEDFSPDGQIIF